jgi:TolB-like protein/Tfp pilus assembly protein PilF
MAIHSVHEQIPLSAEISLQLARISNSKQFSNKALLRRFLVYVVEETIAGRINEIKEYTIGTRALGRPADFNPQFDACVRIHAGRLRQTLETYYHNNGKGDPIRIQIPKGSYIPVFSFVPTGPSPAVKSQDGPHAAPLLNKLTIAVLPFQNLSSEAGKHFFADVIGEQLSTEISHCRNISVISYYSARLFAGRLTDLKQLFTQYGVHYALTGSVQLVDDNIRINVQLTFTVSSEQIWVATYEQPLSDHPLTNVLEDVIQNMASVIAGYYGAIIQHISITPPHQQAELLGIHNAAFWHYKYHNNYNVPTLLMAKEALEKTLQQAPANALAWAVLGEINLDSYILDINPSSIIKYGMDCARKAINLDRYCLHGYQTLAWAFLLQKNKVASMKVIDECLALNYSSASNIGWLGLTLVYLGEYERGKVLLEKAMTLNPFYPWCYSFTMAIYHYIKEDYETALSWAEKIHQPTLQFDLIIRMVILERLGLVQEGQQLGRELQMLWPGVSKEVKPFLQKFILYNHLIKRMVQGLQACGMAIDC